MPDVNKPNRFRTNPSKAKVYFLKPQLLCEVSYAGLTTDGVMRHPLFEGMRTDKSAGQVVMEKELPISGAKRGIKNITGKVE